MYKVLAKVAGTVYRYCDHIVVVSPAFKSSLVAEWNINPDKISVVVNGVDSELFNADVSGGAVRQQLGVQDKFVVSFIGTIGNAHGLDLLVETAKRLSLSHPNVVFLVVGEGAEKGKLQHLVAQSGLANFRILDQQSRDRIPEMIGASDACLVLLKKSEVFKTVIPTKMLEFMACGRAVILGVEGVAQQIMETANAGICIAPESSDALHAAIARLQTDADLRKSLGHNGATFITAHMSRRTTAAEYLKVLSGVLRQMDLAALASRA